MNRNVLPRLSRISVDLFVLLSPGRLQSSEEQRGSAEVHCRLARAQACAMALSFKKDLDKYKDLDEDEILNKLSAEELKQLETALEEMDPEVRLSGKQGVL